MNENLMEKSNAVEKLRIPALPRLAQMRLATVLFGIVDRIYGINTMKTISGQFDNLVYPVNPV